jgi:competence protein ComEC
MCIPLIPLALSLAAGILLGQVFLFLPGTASVLFCALLAAGLLRARRSAKAVRKVLAAALTCLFGTALFIHAALFRPPDSYVGRIGPAGSVHVIAGAVASPLDRGTDRTTFLLQVAAVDSRPASGRLRVSLRGEDAVVGYGDKVELTGRTYAPRGYRNPGGFDYPAQLARQGIFAVLSVPKRSAVRILSPGTGPHRTIEDLREKVRRAFLDGTSGDASAVLRAMVLGDSSGLTDDLRERFMAAGVTHILSISGSHLGLVAVLCFWCVRNILLLLPERCYHRLTLHLDPKKAAALVTAVPVVFYAVLAGAQTATIRSLIMILAGLTALVLDREGDLYSALALAALIILLPDPQSIFNLSFQLSYLSVLAILFVAQTQRSVVGPQGGVASRLLRKAVLLLILSAATALATGPLVALYFNQLSLIGIVANMVVVPLAGAVLVPLGLTTGLFSLLAGHLPLAGLDQFVASAFVSLVSFFAELPHAAVHLPAPGILFLTGYAGLLVSAALAVRARLLRTHRPFDFPGRTSMSVFVTMALSACLLLLVLALPHLRQPHTRVTFLDVGQGDSALVETAGGCTILIDGGGTRDNRFDTGRRVAAPYLWDRGVRSIDLAVLSHPHPDHMNGLTSLLGLFPVREVWTSGLDTGLDGYREFVDAVGANRIPLRSVGAGTRISLKDATIEVLHPSRDFLQRSRKAYAGENDRSLVLRVLVGQRTFLFPGDIHAGGEQALLRSGRDLTADVVKVPHHGSRTSSSAGFVRAIGPSAAVVPVGAGNPYRHPAGETMERYRSAGARVFRTDLDGAVIVTDGNGGLTFLTDAELSLTGIVPGGIGDWRTTEGANWKRLWIREWAI